MSSVWITPSLSVFLMEHATTTCVDVVWWSTFLTITSSTSKLMWEEIPTTMLNYGIVPLVEFSKYIGIENLHVLGDSSLVINALSGTVCVHNINLVPLVD